MAAHFASQNIPTLVLAVEETKEDLMTTGDALGLGLSELQQGGALQMADLTRPMDGPTVVSGDYDLYGLVHRLESAVKQHSVKAIIVDSITALFSPRPPQDQLRNHFFQLVHALRRLEV